MVYATHSDYDKEKPIACRNAKASLSAKEFVITYIISPFLSKHSKSGLGGAVFPLDIYNAIASIAKSFSMVSIRNEIP
jgi:hypothetical protein